MNALLWKKYKWFARNKKNTIYFFIVPIVVLLSMFFLNKNHDIVTFYFPFIVTILGMLFDSTDIENIVHKEFTMYTPITLKKCWIMNAVISWSTRLIYSVGLFILGYLAYNLIYGGFYTSFFILLKGIINGFAAFGVILFSSQCEVDFTIWKQYLSFMWGSAAILWIFILDKSSSVFPTSFAFSVCLLTFSLILIILALSINKNINTEKFIKSLENVRRIASSRFNLVD